MLLSFSILTLLRSKINGVSITKSRRRCIYISRVILYYITRRNVQWCDLIIARYAKRNTRCLECDATRPRFRRYISQRARYKKENVSYKMMKIFCCDSSFLTKRKYDRETRSYLSIDFFETN